MKKRGEVKDLLGLTQDEMALVLNISRSQWSMFKSGQRDLPLAAMQQLAGLLDGLQNKVISTVVLQLTEEERMLANTKIKEAHMNLQIKYHRLEKEIAILEKNRAECFAALQTATFLEVQKEQLELANSIKNRVMKSLNKYSLHKLEALYLKKQTAEMLKNTLEEKINTF